MLYEIILYIYVNSKKKKNTGIIQYTSMVICVSLSVTGGLQLFQEFVSQLVDVHAYHKCQM